MCEVRYNYILHFEHLDEEEEQMLEELGLRESFPPVVLNREGRPREGGVSQTYLGMLQHEDWRRLRSLYSKDTSMFGYTQEVEELGMALELQWSKAGGSSS